MRPTNNKSRGTLLQVGGSYLRPAPVSSGVRLALSDKVKSTLPNFVLPNCDKVNSPIRRARELVPPLHRDFYYPSQFQAACPGIGGWEGMRSGLVGFGRDCSKFEGRPAVHGTSGMRAFPTRNALLKGRRIETYLKISTSFRFLKLTSFLTALTHRKLDCIYACAQYDNCVVVQNLNMCCSLRELTNLSTYSF